MICNKCGSESNSEWSDITPIEIDFGYGSDYDMQKWIINLCDNCINEIVDEFEVPPSIDEWV